MCSRCFFRCLSALRRFRSFRSAFLWASKDALEILLGSGCWTFGTLSPRPISAASPSFSLPAESSSALNSRSVTDGRAFFGDGLSGISRSAPSVWMMEPLRPGRTAVIHSRCLFASVRCGCVGATQASTRVTATWHRSSSSHLDFVGHAPHQATTTPLPPPPPSKSAPPLLLPLTTLSALRVRDQPCAERYWASREEQLRVEGPRE